MRGLFLSALLAAVANSPEVSSNPVTFHLLLGEEVEVIDCSTISEQITQMQKLVSEQELKVRRYRQAHTVADRVDGENLLLLTLRWKHSYLLQELAVLEFGEYYCRNPKDIPASGKVDIEALLM